MYLQNVLPNISNHVQLYCFVTVYPVEFVYVKKSLDFGKLGIIKTSYVVEGH